MDSEHKSRWRYLPNALSVLRIALIPVIIWMSLNSWPFIAFCTFLLGALTDLLDGQLARRYGWHSHSGAILDPVADKLFVLCLIPLLWHYGSIIGLYVLVLVLRYGVQLSVFPVLLGWLKRPFKVAPKFIPKLATAVAYIVLGLGFLEQVAIDQLPDVSQRENFLGKSIGAASLIGSLLEIWVLVKFLPRYWKIARGKEDTFD